MSLQGYDTHLPMLAYCVANSTGPVLELGMGDASTPFLHALCKGRLLVSGDFNSEWCEKYRAFETLTHIIAHVTDWLQWGYIKDPIQRWGAVLVDQSPGEMRTPVVRALKGKAKFLVLHDSEKDHGSGANYGYEQVIPLFKYASEYRYLRPYTMVLSDDEEVPLDEMERVWTPPK